MREDESRKKRKSDFFVCFFQIECFFHSLILFILIILIIIVCGGLTSYWMAVWGAV